MCVVVGVFCIEEAREKRRKEVEHLQMFKVL